MKTNAELYPFILEPAYKDYVWGGDRIPSRFNRNLPAGIYAESWELSDRVEGMSHAANGVLKGQSLAELVARFGAELVGRGFQTARFPLLVKLIDTRERLSIQVHPDNENAAQGFGQAKTEAWHILDAPKGGRVFAGLNTGVNQALFLDALKKGLLADRLQSVPVSTGDTLLVPAGCVHAICENLLVLEVQQNSDTTYRVYDWDRVDKTGKPRELHLEQALKVIRWSDPAPALITPIPISTKPGAKVMELVSSPYFRLESLEITAPFFVQHSGASFHALITKQDEVQLMSAAGTVIIPRGRTCLIPAGLEQYTLKPNGRQASLLRISLPA